MIDNVFVVAEQGIARATTYARSFHLTLDEAEAWQQTNPPNWGQRHGPIYRMWPSADLEIPGPGFERVT